MTTTVSIQEAPSQYETLLANYANILEKTNNQLSLWWNPYAVMIGILTILIAFITIGFSVYFWLNSREQKKDMKEFYEKREEENKTVMNAIKERSDRESKMMEERGRRAKEYEESLDELISSYKEYKEKLSKLDKDNKKDMERIEKVVDELNKAKASLGKYELLPEVIYDPKIHLSSYPNSSVFFNKKPSIKHIICENCGLDFKYKDSKVDVQFADSVFVYNRKKVYCPHCGKENYLV